MRILLVEDNKVNQLVAVCFLRKGGHAVVTANDGAEAVALFDTEPFDIILMDVQMPHMDGFEATAAIRHRETETGTHTPIIGVSAYSADGCKEQCIAAGMDDYVPKPIRFADLMNTINQLAVAQSFLGASVGRVITGLCTGRKDF